MRVRHGKDVSQPGNDVMIVDPGGDAVEMTPQTFPALIGGIGMEPVAVQQHELTGADALSAALKGQGQRALLNVHQQKAVKGFPGQAIARQIRKKAALQGI